MRVEPYCEAGQRLEPEARTDRRSRSGANRAAEQSGLELLIRAEDRRVHHGVAARRAVGAVAAGAGHRARHQAAVIAPVEAHPRAALPGLVLDVGGLVELLVVVDAEDPRRRRGVAPAPPTCGVKKRAATLENTTSAENPWIFGTLTRPA